MYRGWPAFPLSNNTSLLIPPFAVVLAILTITPDNACRFGLSGLNGVGKSPR